MKSASSYEDIHGYRLVTNRQTDGGAYAQHIAERDKLTNRLKEQE